MCHRWIWIVVSLAVCSGCRAAPDVGRPASSPWFDDRAHDSGLHFVHVNGMSGHFYFHEIMGSGVALFDYDNDGDLDVFFVQGAGKSRLFRNDLDSLEGQGLTFTDVTEQSGINTTEFGMGVATGDFDNDGCVDLYLTNFGRNQLYRNNCDGTFTDVTARADIASPGWSVSAVFVDYDRDGWLDLFVGHYVSYSVAHDTPCFSVSGRRDYCSPNAYRPEQNRLYHNNHDGTFTDVTTRAGLAGNFGPTLGVVADDVDGDGWVDLYVANDGRENQLWINRHDGTFRNAGLLSGAALTADGKAPGSMGVDAADLDGDGMDDFLATTLVGEGTSLFLGRGAGGFEDAAARSGIRALTLGSTGFGVHSIDVDNDGWLDVLTVNGAVRTIESLAQAGDRFPFAQRKLLLHNVGAGRFEDAGDRAGAVFLLAEIGRGAAFGDIDNDGDTDVVVSNNNGPARLLINEVGNKSHWVGFCLQTGARVDILRPNSPTSVRRAATDGSYASASDPRVLVGLGHNETPPTVRVTWPDGRTEQWNALPIDRYTTLTEGTGR